MFKRKIIHALLIGLLIPAQAQQPTPQDPEEQARLSKEVVMPMGQINAVTKLKKEDGRFVKIGKALLIGATALMVIAIASQVYQEHRYAKRANIWYKQADGFYKIMSQREGGNKQLNSWEYNNLMSKGHLDHYGNVYKTSTMAPLFDGVEPEASVNGFDYYLLFENRDGTYKKLSKQEYEQIRFGALFIPFYGSILSNPDVHNM